MNYKKRTIVIGGLAALEEKFSTELRK